MLNEIQIIGINLLPLKKNNNNTKFIKIKILITIKLK